MRKQVVKKYTKKITKQISKNMLKNFNKKNIKKSLKKLSVFLEKKACNEHDCINVFLSFTILKKMHQKIYKKKC